MAGIRRRRLPTHRALGSHTRSLSQREGGGITAGRFSSSISTITPNTRVHTSGRVFYGWVIVAVMAAVGALSMALGGLNFGLFIKPMDDELGAGRALFGWAQSARSFASALTSPLVGGLIDRFGVRVLLTVAALMTGVALVGLSYVTAGWHIVALFALMGVVGMSGPGALVTSVPATKWFVHKRGKALAYMSLGIPIGGMVFVPLSQLLIDTVGWRQTWIILATLGVVGIVPLSLIFVRRQPEDLGLLPDGDPPHMAGRTEVRPRPVEEPSWTRHEALRSSTFWRLVVVFSLVQMSIGAVAVHRIPSFMDRGLDPRLISYATALDAAASGISTFAMGLLVRRIAARYIGAAGFTTLSLASVLTITADTHAGVFASMILFGTGIGVLLLMSNYLWAEYFGRHHLGAIRGAVMPATLIFGGAGAPLAGYVRDATGSYTLVWSVAAGLMLLGGAVLAITPPPGPPPGVDQAANKPGPLP